MGGRIGQCNLGELVSIIVTPIFVNFGVYGIIFPKMIFV